MVQDPPLRIMSASPGHYITDVGTPSDNAPAPWDIRSTANGAVVGNYQRIRDLPDRVPQLVGDYAIESGADYVVARKIGTAQSVRYDPPAGAKIRGDYPGGMLIVRTADGSFALRDYDGTERPVTGLPADAAVWDRTDNALLLVGSLALYVLDLTTGTATKAATFTDNLWWAQLTPGRVIWQTSTTDTATNLAWKARTGAGEGTVSIPTRQELATVGDDVVFRDPGTEELTKVAVDTGNATAHFVTDVQDAEDLGNGKLLVAAQGGVATVAADGVLHPVSQTPPYAGQARHVALVGDRVLISELPLLDGFASERTAKQVTGTSNLGTVWTPVAGVTTTGQLQAAGNNLITDEVDSEGHRSWRLVTPNGGKQYGDLRLFALGRGGKLAKYQEQQIDPIQILDTEQNRIVGQVGGPVALDGDTYWTGLGTNNTLTGRQVGGFVEHGACRARL